MKGALRSPHWWGEGEEEVPEQEFPSRRWTEERRGDKLADEAPKKGGALSFRSRSSWLRGHIDVEAEEDMEVGKGEGGRRLAGRRNGKEG